MTEKCILFIFNFRQNKNANFANSVYSVKILVNGIVLVQIPYCYLEMTPKYLVAVEWPNEFLNMEQNKVHEQGPGLGIHHLVDNEKQPGKPRCWRFLQRRWLQPNSSSIFLTLFFSKIIDVNLTTVVMFPSFFNGGTCCIQMSSLPPSPPHKNELLMKTFSTRC